MPAPTRHRGRRVRDLFPRIVFLSFTERDGEVGMRFTVKIAPRNTIQGAKTRAIARAGGPPPNQPRFQKPSKNEGAYRFSLRAHNLKYRVRNEGSTDGMTFFDHWSNRGRAAWRRWSILAESGVGGTALSASLAHVQLRL